MKLSKLWIIFILPLLLAGCGHSVKHRTLTLDSIKTWRNSEYAYNSHTIRRVIDSLRLAAGDTAYIDRQTDLYYAADSAFLWVSRKGIDARADTLLAWGNKVSDMGFSPKCFYCDIIRKDLKRLKCLDFDTEPNDINHVMARLEYYLTKAFMRYASGQRFGFINPRLLFNTLEKTDTAQNAGFKTLFDMRIDLPGPHFLAKARYEQRYGDLGKFLLSVQPTDSTYYKYLDGYKRHQHDGSAYRWLVNLERCRWRILPNRGDKYVIVNIPALELYAYDKSVDSTLNMRICCGQVTNKTPLLSSNIQRLELNPYWIVPRSIIRKEIAQHHAGDTSYFNRNNMKIIDKTSHKEINPALASADLLLSGTCWIRQKGGEGNSLGRMIFRFPNNLSIYLHDTNNREVFTRQWRYLSHGCIRLERPLDLATFLLPEYDELTVDKMRISIDLPPLTEKGMKLAKQTKRPIGTYHFNPQTPLFIVYYTLFPNAQGEICSYPDIYGYDELIRKKLSMYF